MTAVDLRGWLDAQTRAADEALASCAAAGDVDELLRCLDELRLRAFACGVLSADLARISSH